MKKLLPLAFLLVFAASCNKEKVYKENLEGTWNVYKYLLYNVDRTTQFKNQYGSSYSIAFTSDGKFTETVYGNDTVVVDGTYGFEDNDIKLVLTNTAYNLVDTTLVPYQLTREYTILNLTRNHVELLNDSSRTYMSKQE